VQNKKLQKTKVSYKKVVGGNFYTNYEAKLGISLPEFSQTNVVQHHFAINDSDDEGIGYDVIIGQDLYDVLGIDVQYSNCAIQRNSRSITMKNSNFPVQQVDILSREIKQVIARTEEPKVTAEATDRIVKILDSDHHNADLQKVVTKATQLNKLQQLSLLRLLQKSEALFDGTLLGKWNTDPTQLNKLQQLSLLRLLQKSEALFDGTLGKWNTDPVNIELCENATVSPLVLDIILFQR
jgi:hypothetical protein